MERLTSYKSECRREMICRYEDCDTCEEYCPHLNENNCPCLQEVLEKLAEYEDLEEQGKLLKPPCAVGDTVYEINKMNEIISEFTVIGFSVSEHGIFIKWKLVKGTYRNLSGFNDDEIGKTVFLIRGEAEAALKNLPQNQRCKECICKSCFYKEDCCPECDGAILGCAEYLKTKGDAGKGYGAGGNMNNFDRAIESLEDIIDESTNDDGSLDEFYEDINLAIDCIEVVKHMKKLMD